MEGTVFIWITVVLYVILHGRAKSKDKFETLVGYGMISVACCLSILIYYNIAIEEVMLFLNNTIGRFTRTVVS